MELNHILIALGITVVLTIVAYLLTKPKYYKGSTVYLYFRTKDTLHDRIVFVRKGYSAPEDLLKEIDTARKEIEEKTGAPAVLQNIKIFRPQWKVK